LILGGIKGSQYAKAIGRVDEDGLDEALTQLTDAMLARAGFPCRCETFPGEYRQVKVTTDEASAGMLIGRHGQTVDAVEHLVERMASNALDARARVNLDINNYRLRREEMLVERVGEAAERIRETGRPFHMEPMSGRERRIVHLETASLGGLRTFTVDGSGGKHVVIAPEEESSQEDQGRAGELRADFSDPGTEELTDSDT
jgi:spoIIIJ-associated protein